MSKQRLETFMSGWRSHDFQCPPIIAEPETAAVRQLGKQFCILAPADIVQQQRAAGWQSLDGFKQADGLGAHGSSHARAAGPAALDSATIIPRVQQSRNQTSERNHR